MTREELREYCERTIRGYETWVRDCGVEPHGKAYEGLKLILELIEQESVIDKIRAEIAEIPKKYPMTMDYENGLKEALAIIDKYKAESEDKENE